MLVQKIRGFVGGRVSLVVPALAGLMLTLGGSAAQAQSPPTGPGGVDYAALTTTFSTAITPIMSTALPVCLTIMAVWLAPSLIRTLIKKFAHA